MLCCLGPYHIESSVPNRTDDLIFVDYSKTRLICVISACGQPNIVSGDNCTILSVAGGCPAKDCDIKWYECKQTLGRTYSILITPCQIYISKFENGLDSLKSCSGQDFGSGSFCFGKIYTQTGVFDADTNCYCSFIFDGHTFKVTGSSSECFDSYDCSECWAETDEVKVLAMGQDLPTVIPEPQDEISISEPEQQHESINYERRTVWHNSPVNSSGQDTLCFDEVNVAQWLTDGETHSDCGSHDKPSIATLPSGHAVIAYESRESSGETSIKLAVLNTSVSNKIYYYRKLGFGTLLNTSDQSHSVFETFDDFFIETDDSDKPENTNIKIGFLSGPLAGNLFSINSISREIQTSGQPKRSISFNVPFAFTFESTNHVYNTSWFLIDAENTDLPSDSSIGEILSLPQHKFNNVPVPVANPSVSCASNNLMIGGEQFIYVTYQAFENKKWNVYLQQICLNDNESSSPVYAAPYLFQSPDSELVSLVSTATTVKYVIKDLVEDSNQICAIFEVFLADGHKVVNCDQSVGNSIYTGCNGTTAAKKNALVDASFNKLLCSSESPNWSVGQEFAGPYPPTYSDLGVTTSSCLNLTLWPESIDDWCVFQSICTQYSVFDDPYCPSPYLAVKFYPEDLWTIKVDNDIITRVLYHMSTATIGESSKQVDFMFAIDYSESTRNYINQAISAIPQFAEKLAIQNISVRFGLTVFARGSNSDVINPMTCNCGAADGFADSDIFDGLESQGVSEGFTTDVQVLINAMNSWSNLRGGSAPYSAIQFATLDPHSTWRSDSQKYVFMITDTGSEFGDSCNCSNYSNTKELALQALTNQNVKLILSTCQSSDGDICEISSTNPSDLVSLSEESGWEQGAFLINGSYTDIFDHISISTTENVAGSRIIERDVAGYDSTFIKNAEIIITYASDLTEIWTQNKSLLYFVDIIPSGDSSTKGITTMPYDLVSGNYYGIDPVHVQGNSENWVYFSESKPIVINYPHVGHIESEHYEPILIAQNAGQSKVLVNNRNQVIIAYESYESGMHQIGISGSGDFHQNSITGPKARRITRFLTATDFAWSHSITTNSEGLNQLCDIVIDNNDITHIAWQSNRDQYWEIYYANSYDLFEPVRVTKSNSRSVHPAIEVDNQGTIFIVYNDNRFGPYQIMLANKNETRVLPLLEQDPYLASIRNNYIHYTNILPLYIDNPTTRSIANSSTLWGSKTASGFGNDEENALFSINLQDGTINSGSLVDYEIEHITFTADGKLYGITNDGKLLLISSISETSNVNLDQITVIGTLRLYLGNDIYGDTIFLDEFIDGSDNAVLSSLGSWTQAKLDSTSINEVDFKICRGTIGPCLCEDTGCTSLWTSSSLYNTPTTYTQTLSGRPIYNTSLNASVKLSRTPSSDQFSGPTITLLIRSQLLDTVDLTNPGQACYLISLKRQFIQKDTVRQIWTVNAKRNQGSALQWDTGNENLEIEELEIPDITSDDWLNVRVDTYNQGRNVKFDVYLNDILIKEYFDDTIYSQGNPSDPILFGPYYGIASTVGTGEYPSTTAYISAIVGKVELKEINNIRSDAVHKVCDITSDPLNRLWMLTTETNETSKVNIVQLNPESAEILTSTTIFDSNVTKSEGAIAVDSSLNFYIVSYIDSNPVLYSSPYPSILNSSASFNFANVSELNVNVISMSANHNGELYGIDSLNDLYTIDKSTGATNIQVELTSDSSSHDSLPIGTSSSISFIITQIEQTGDAGFFHLLIEFYDNINFDGEPSLIVDSRDNLESFINEEITENEYGTFGMDGRGIYLNVNQVGRVYFDATHFRPGYSNLSSPYSFDTNQTYFPKVSSVDSSGSQHLSKIIQSNSFSCNRCSRESTNSIDFEGCSYSFIFTNDSLEQKIVQFQVDFYADSAKQHLIRRFNLRTSEDSDFQYVEINNQATSELISSDGIVADAEQSLYIQVYPSLDPQSGFLCGLNYTVQVNIRFNPGSGTFNQIESSPETPNTFECNCSAKFMTMPQTLITSLNRWQTSANGYSDTRITDVLTDSVKPSIKSRSSTGTIISWSQVNSDTTKSSIKAGIFDHTNQDQLLSSGSGSWFDYDFSIEGKNIDLEVDLFDRTLLSYDKNDADSFAGPHGHEVSPQELPSNSVLYKNCDFTITQEIITESDKCDISGLESNIVTGDEFVSPSIIKKVAVRSDFVDYYTYNSSGIASPIVSVCEIMLEIYGTPEVVAFRLKNEDSHIYSDWCSWSPMIGDYYTETKWALSLNPGIKEVCVQCMTYSGTTSEFCLTVIGDYKKTTFDIKFYKDTSGIGQWPANDSELVELPQFNQIPVAGLLPSSTTDKTVLVAIYPHEDIANDIDLISFDVIQQGSNDIIEQTANKSTLNDKMVYKGFFVVEKEDNIFNVDGFARIRPRLPGSCLEHQEVSLGVYFDKNKYNSINPTLSLAELEEDVLQIYRQTITGKIGADITTRGSEDPYFIFGDPNYLMKTFAPTQSGIQAPQPLQITIPDGDGGGSGDGGDDGNGGPGG